MICECSMKSYYIFINVKFSIFGLIIINASVNNRFNKLSQKL